VTTAYPLFTPEIPFSISQNETLSFGEGSDAITTVWAAKNNLGKSATRTYDLTEGITDVAGASLAFNTIKVLVLKNISDQFGSAAEITLSTNGIGFLSGTTPAISVPAGSSIMLSNLGSGWTINNGSADTLVLTNLDSGNGAWFELMVAGVIIDESSSSSSLSSESSSSSP
jgi:hypothetical protein